MSAKFGTEMGTNGKAVFDPAFPVENSPAIPHFELREVAVSELDEWWPIVLPEIKAIIEGNPACDFIHQEVYSFVYRKAAFLLIGFLDGEYVGFGIVQFKQRDFSRERYLLSWIGGGLNTEAVNLYFLELEKIARRLKINVLRHEGRVGWVRRLPGPGWKTLAVIQERRLD